MGNITVYTFIDRDDQPFNETWHTQDYREAKAYAQEHGLLIIANEFAWSDSEPLEDCRPKSPRRKSRR